MKRSSIYFTPVVMLSSVVFFKISNQNLPHFSHSDGETKGKRSFFTIWKVANELADVGLSPYCVENVLVGL